MEQKTLKESAQAYESHSVGNIADLPKVSTDLQLEEREGTNDEGKTFQYKVIIVDNQEYDLSVLFKRGFLRIFFYLIRGYLKILRYRYCWGSTAPSQYIRHHNKLLFVV